MAVVGFSCAGRRAVWAPARACRVNEEEGTQLLGTSCTGGDGRAFGGRVGAHTRSFWWQSCRSFLCLTRPSSEPGRGSCSAGELPCQRTAFTKRQRGRVPRSLTVTAAGGAFHGIWDALRCWLTRTLAALATAVAHKGEARSGGFVRNEDGIPWVLQRVFHGKTLWEKEELARPPPAHPGHWCACAPHCRGVRWVDFRLRGAHRRNGTRFARISGSPRASWLMCGPAP